MTKKTSNTDSIINEIRKLQNKITDAEKEKANINGRIDNILETTNKKFDSSSIEELATYISKKEKQLKKIDGLIKDKYEELKKKQKELEDQDTEENDENDQ